MNEKVSIIIPTYNRFNYLMNTIKSCKEQTYKNTEIIVINDRSTQEDYYNYNWEGVTVIHLEKNTKEVFGYGCAAYVRNKGIEISNGKYIAFCDDDDIWLPNKLELQINAMKRTGCKMSSSDGFIGRGVYNPSMKYKKYNGEYFFNTLKKKYQNIPEFVDDFPEIWNWKFVRTHNAVICSSVVIEKEVLTKINNFRTLRPPGEDYDCWLRAMKETDSVYVNDVCFYYDLGHAGGRHY